MHGSLPCALCTGCCACSRTCYPTLCCSKKCSMATAAWMVTAAMITRAHAPAKWGACFQSEPMRSWAPGQLPNFEYSCQTARKLPNCQCSSSSVLTAASGSPCFTMLSPTRMAPQPAAARWSDNGSMPTGQRAGKVTAPLPAAQQRSKDHATWRRLGRPMWLATQRQLTRLHKRHVGWREDAALAG